MKIAVVGKGGSGKTTIAATLARLFARQGYSVLALDGDPNPNLGVALGISEEGLARLDPLPRSIMAEHVDDEGNRVLKLAQPIQTVTAEQGVSAPDGVTLLLGGRVDHPGAG